MYRSFFIFFLSINMAYGDHSDIRIISSFTELAPILDAIPQKHTNKVLICFDVDFTLWVGTHPAANLSTIKKYSVDFRHLFDGTSQLQRERIYNLATRACEQELVEANAPFIIKRIQNKGFRTIAFTAALCGPIADLRRHELWRFQKLRSLGVDFSQSFPLIPERFLVTIPRYNNNYPVFYRGLLCANGERAHNGKAEALFAFLKTAHFKPHTIVMIDDRIETLEKMMQFFHQISPQTQFIAIHYRGAYERATRDISREDFLKFWFTIKAEALSIS